MYFVYLQKMKEKRRNTNTNIRYDKNQTGPVSDCQRPRYSKTCLKQPLKSKQKVLKTNDSLMNDESIAECSLGALCNTFDLH